MKVEALGKVLRELQSRGWPVDTQELTATDYFLHWPDGTCSYITSPDGDEQNPNDGIALTLYWLVAQLEARGYYREIEQAEDWIGVLLYKRGSREPIVFQTADDELSAHLYACLTLPALPTDAQQTTQGETTAGGDDV